MLSGDFPHPASGIAAQHIDRTSGNRLSNTL
jgi:hypothetical protein